jgi:hypothetical protein
MFKCMSYLYRFKTSTGKKNNSMFSPILITDVIFMKNPIVSKYYEVRIWHKYNIYIYILSYYDTIVILYDITFPDEVRHFFPIQDYTADRPLARQFDHSQQARQAQQAQDTQIPSEGHRKSKGFWDGDWWEKFMGKPYKTIKLYKTNHLNLWDPWSVPIPLNYI